MHIYKYNETVPFRMWACLRKSWHWYTQTLKTDYTALSLVFYTKQHTCNTVKLKIFWFSFTIISKYYQSFCTRYYHTFFSILVLLMYWEKKGKIKLKLSFLKSIILTGTHRILLKLHHSDEGWKEYEEFMLLNNLNSESQNCGQHCEPELNLLGFVTGRSWFSMFLLLKEYLFVSTHKTPFSVSVAGQ